MSPLFWFPTLDSGFVDVHQLFVVIGVREKWYLGVRRWLKFLEENFIAVYYVCIENANPSIPGFFVIFDSSYDLESYHLMLKLLLGGGNFSFLPFKLIYFLMYTSRHSDSYNISNIIKWTYYEKLLYIHYALDWSENGNVMEIYPSVLFNWLTSIVCKRCSLWPWLTDLGNVVLDCAIMVFSTDYLLLTLLWDRCC